MTKILFAWQQCRRCQPEWLCKLGYRQGQGEGQSSASLRGTGARACLQVTTDFGRGRRSPSPPFILLSMRPRWRGVAPPPIALDVGFTSPPVANPAPYGVTETVEALIAAG